MITDVRARLRPAMLLAKAIPVTTWILAVSGWAVLALTNLPPAAPIRSASVFFFVLLCPGLALSALLPASGMERWTLAVSLSIAVGLLVTTAMNLADIGSFLWRLAVLATVTTLAAVAGGVISMRRNAAYTRIG